jgi:hypothetical protein
MSISITTQGKYACIKAEAIPALVGLLSDENTDVRLNVIKASICNYFYVSIGFLSGFFSYMRVDILGM